MHTRRIFSAFLILIVGLFLVGGSPLADFADAKARSGGRSFSKFKSKKPPISRSMSTNKSNKKKDGSFGRGLAGGLLGGALGGLLFGSMMGMGGSGMGLLPILLLAGVGWFLYRQFKQKAQHKGYSQQGGGGFGSQQPGSFNQGNSFNQNLPGSGPMNVPPPPPPSTATNDNGLDAIWENDPDFDPQYFMEVASDVFFKVQAGWMRRDITSFKHLLGEQLAQEYADHFTDMRERGVINKLESIAVRKTDIQQAGCTGNEDFVTVLFTANLLDYTVDEASGEIVEGSDTEPIKFEEEWTWTRPVGTQDWRLEGIHSPE